MIQRCSNDIRKMEILAKYQQMFNTVCPTLCQTLCNFTSYKVQNVQYNLPDALSHTQPKFLVFSNQTSLGKTLIARALRHPEPNFFLNFDKGQRTVLCVNFCSAVCSENFPGQGSKVTRNFENCQIFQYFQIRCPSEKRLQLGP